MATTFKTGTPLLDHYLGGGLPRGVTSIYGPDDVGATSLSLSIAREAALRDAQTAFISLKGGTSAYYIQTHCGPNCAFSSPRFGEEAFEQAALLLEGGISVLIMDPLDGAVPIADMSDMVGTRDPSDQARLIYMGLQTLRDLAFKHDALVLVVSEVRTLLPTRKLVPTYRNAVWDCSGTMLSLRQKGYKSEYGTVLYKDCELTIEKSMTSPPLVSFPYRVWSNRGLDRDAELTAALLSHGHIEVRGPYCSIDGELLGNGFAKTKTAVSKRYNELYSRFMEDVWRR